MKTKAGKKLTTSRKSKPLKFKVIFYKPTELTPKQRAAKGTFAEIVIELAAKQMEKNFPKRNIEEVEKIETVK